MIRSTYRNIMLTVLVAAFGLAYYLFSTAQDMQQDIENRKNDIIRLQQEYENAQNLNVALTELDNLTITEQTATQLDILRHLGLENTDVGFDLEARDVHNINSTQLYIHTVVISGDMPYADALALCDKLQNTKKIVITSIEVHGPQPGGNSNNVNLKLTGMIYGLDKDTPTVQLQPDPAQGGNH